MDSQEAADTARLIKTLCPIEVTITDVKIPFGSMVVIILKFVLACIPAAIIIGVVSAVVIGLITGITSK